MEKAIIHCQRSGLPLMAVSTMCSHGWPLINSFKPVCVHPIYSMPLVKLLVKLQEQVNKMPDGHDAIETRIIMSAIMHNLEALHFTELDQPSLPAEHIALGSAERLLKLAGEVTKLIELPLYHVAKVNANLAWENFAVWLDAASEVADRGKKDSLKQNWEEILAERADAMAEVKTSTVYKKLDFHKVWRWMEQQISQHSDYPAGRLATFKELFMRGEVTPEDWIADDVDDLVEAVLKCCDTGNEITFFIHSRLNRIRANIEAFYSSFTLLGSKTAVSLSILDEPTAQEQQFLKKYDEQVAALIELPPTPVRSQFPTLGAYLKAQAQHNILARRWKEISSKASGASRGDSPKQVGLPTDDAS